MTVEVPTDTLTNLIEPVAKSLGYDLIRVTYGGGRRPTLQIMAEREDGTMSVDDCARLSREVSMVLDVEDPLKAEYLLEVSSPGIDRPLTRRKDFERWMGFDAKVELDEAIESRRRFRGKLVGLEGDVLTMDVDGEDMTLPFQHIQKAKLIMTDALLEAVTRAANAQEPNQE